MRVVKVKWPPPGHLLPWFVGILVLLGLSAGVSAGLPNEICADCHDEVVQAWTATSHGTYFNGHDNYSCESCHGSGMAHVEEGGDASMIINPAKTSQFDADLLCLNCHKGPQFDQWHFSGHNGGDVNCASCHKIHLGFDDKRPSAPDLCYQCHADVRAASMMPSHHPIAEGKVDCQDCHGVHGGGGRLTQDNSGRELCFSCHADKEGPFMYEHAPVNEDCGYCHTPHGSVADKLLVQTEPALCLNCHSMHFHATVASPEADWSGVPAGPGRSGTGDTDGWKAGMLTKCTQCHTEIHGTDSPSQSISTGGGALTR
ncbi:MAG: DmsE family decaheme c-type cytochrome [bacterium]